MMNDKAYELVNELISASIAFGRGIEPDWQTRIEKARVAVLDYVAELEMENKKALEFIRVLRMYCICAKWDNPDTADEFGKFDEEMCEWLALSTEANDGVY